jgi:ABC-type transporter Mla subunit MlaD
VKPVADTHQDNSRLLIQARFAIAASVFALAISLAYFTFEFSRLATYVPEVIESVDQTVDKIDPIIAQVDTISGLVPSILQETAEIRVLIPSVLEQVENTNSTLRPAIEEYAKTNEQLPRILEEYTATRELLPEMLPGILKTADNVSFAVVTVTREVGANRELLPEISKTADKTAQALVIFAEQVEEIQPMLPDMMKTAGDASNAIIIVSSEIEQLRPLIPDILAEVEQTREMMPPMMSRAERLVKDANEVAKTAGEGATSGFFTGIIKAPFVLIGDIGEAMIGKSEARALLGEEDYNKVKNAALELLSSGQVDDIRDWGTPIKGVGGSVKLMDITEREGRECRVLHILVVNKGESIHDRDRILCINEAGKWDFAD